MPASHRFVVLREPIVSTKFLLLPALLLICFTSGCTTTRTSDTARTGMEQLLISNAVDQTLDKTALPQVQGKKVYLDAQYLDSVDKGYIVGSLRQRLLSSGASLVDAKEGSDITVEVVSGGVGTDNVETYLGVPGLAIPGLPIEVPEVRMYEKSSQFGTAKLGVVAYATESGEMVFDGGRSLARADESRWSVMGIGPFREGSVRDEVRNATGSEYSSAPRMVNSPDFDGLKMR